MHDWDRQSGKTTKQMTDAPENAVFIWCNGHMAYPELLARAIGRDDLAIWPLHRLSARNLRGRKFSALVLDHAAYISEEASEAIAMTVHLGTPVMEFNAI